ncbi:MAG: hypothetical protein K0U76_04395, partial [Actinomycetia bacterium]|nr:hypothetical protein [Actinomycetes bacterium]
MGPSSRRQMIGVAMFALGIAGFTNPGSAVAESVGSDTSTRTEHRSTDSAAPNSADSDAVAADSLDSDSDADLVDGDSDADPVDGDSDADLVDGDSDADLVDGDSAADLVDGDSAADLVDGDSDADLVDGDSDADLVDGDSDPDGEPSAQTDYRSTESATTDSAVVREYPNPSRRPSRTSADGGGSGSMALPAEQLPERTASLRVRGAMAGTDLSSTLDPGSGAELLLDDSEAGPVRSPAAGGEATPTTAPPASQAGLSTQIEATRPAEPSAAVPVADVAALESAVDWLFGGQPAGTPVQSPLSWVVLAAARREARASQSQPTAAPVGTGLVHESSMTPRDGVTATARSAGVAAVAGIAGATATGNLSPAERAFWTEQRGVGFSAGSSGALEDQDRLEGALTQVAAQGFNSIRTWGTDAYTGRILEAIIRLDLPIKVQPGIYITTAADSRSQIDSALEIIDPYADKVIGVSLGNEQIVDWNAAATLTVPQVIDQVAYFKSKSDIPVTYNFAGETFLPGASQWSQNLAGLVEQLDYINVHSYAGFFDNRNNPVWTPDRQLDSLKSYETLLSTRLDSLGLGDKPIVLGETGWQSAGYNPTVTNPDNMQQYYEDVTRYVYGPEARFDGMFYFNFTDEAWKGGDDNWGLFKEGSAAYIGSSKFALATVDEILGDSEGSELQTIRTNGSVALLTDPDTGIAFVRSGAEPAIAITRADSYWSGEVPVNRDGARLVSAAVDATGSLRVLDDAGDVQYGWVLDDTGKFAGEQRYDASTRIYAETMFGVDLDNDGVIGTGERTTPLQTIKSNGPVALLTDPDTGIAFVRSGAEPAIAITRADSYWSGAVPLSRGGSTLISAAIDDTGKLRVLDASGDNQYGWILDDTGRFSGEEKYDTATRTAAEDLFGVDLDNDGIIGTGELTTPLQTIRTNGSVALLTDPDTGIAFVRSGAEPAIAITRADSY